MYDYGRERKRVFTEEGNEMYEQIRGNVVRLLASSGAFTSSAAWKGVTGDSDLMLACLDRMVELRLLREVTGDEVWGQHRIFVSAVR